MNEIDLNGRIAVITGGARGIGFAVAERFRRSGAKLAVWDVDGAEAEAAARRLEGAIACMVDVTNERSVAAALAETERRLGGVDILVASAGIAGPNATVADYPVDAWRKVIDVDLNGVFLCCRAVVPGMVKRNYGRIVNIASIAGKEGNPNAAPYSAAKAGVIALTKVLAKELARRNITVNAVAPGVIETPMMAGVKPEMVAEYARQIPVGRVGRPEEVAHAVLFFACEESSYITGQTLPITGGWF